MLSLAKGRELRQINEFVLAEASPPEDLSRPLEWRKDFQFLRIPLLRVRTSTLCSVSELDWAIFEKKTPWERLKPALSMERSLIGTVDLEELKDHLYQAAPRKDSDLVDIKGPLSFKEISIKEGKPFKGHEYVHDGVYLGSVFSDPDKGEAYVEVHVSNEQMQTLLTSLEQKPDLKLWLGIYVLAYSYEVDDALAEHYHPRDYLVNESTSASVKSLHLYASKSQMDESHDSDSDPSVEVSAPSQTPQATTAVDVAGLSLTIKRLTTAVWFAIAVTVFVALTR